MSEASPVVTADKPDAEDGGGAESLHVVLLGDSTLDNIVWVREDEDSQSVPFHLRGRLGLGDIVTNYAADGYTTSDVLNGGAPFISAHARREAGDPFPDDDFFHPLVALNELVEAAARGEGAAPTHAVLSVGGNDIREILGAMHLLQIRLAAFLENYPKILEAVIASGVKVIVMLQYRPSYVASNYSVYQAMEAVPTPGTAVEKMHHLMEMIYAPILQMCEAMNLPVIDLPNSFDIMDGDLYVSQIEPSSKGGAIIADLIAHVLRTHDYESLVLYSKRDADSEIVARPLDGDWRVTRDEINDGGDEHGVVVASE